MTTNEELKKKFIKNWLSHIKRPNYPQSSIDLMNKELNEMIEESNILQKKQEEKADAKVFESQLVGEVNTDLYLPNIPFLQELEKLMIKHKVQKIDVSWKKKF